MKRTLLLRKSRSFLLGFLLLTAAGCSPGSQGEGPGGRSQHLALTPDQEFALGAKAYREVLSKSHPLPQDSAPVRRVRDVGLKIVGALKIEPLLREIHLTHLNDYRWDWEFNVLESSQVNAFCLPGGRVAVFTGLLRVVENDDQLATVMGHEIAHALAHHASERIYRTQMRERAIQAVGGVLGDDRLIGVLAAGAQVGSLKYERQEESEADHIGLFLMTFAGYNPDEAVKFWERMQQASGGRSVPEILSDHPSDARRIAQMRVWVGQAKAGKRAYDEGRVAR